jgi:hypothetical protein
VLCILSQHIVETHPDAAHATTRSESQKCPATVRIVASDERGEKEMQQTDDG